MTQSHIFKWFTFTFSFLCVFANASQTNLLAITDSIASDEKAPPFKFFLDQSSLKYKELSSKEIVSDFSVKAIPNPESQPFYSYSITAFEYNCTKKEGRSLAFKLYDEKDQLIEEMDGNREVRLLDLGGVSLENTTFHLVCDSKITPKK